LIYFLKNIVGRYEEAIQYHELDVKTCRQAKDPKEEVIGYQNIGRCFQK